ncbi:uncharacterized protein DS421_20g696570 [Arachis hypogaea]|nr:uncharacterized protein DS421_20g696570 [Arachis hypogaea]
MLAMLLSMKPMEEHSFTGSLRPLPTQMISLWSYGLMEDLDVLLWDMEQHKRLVHF